MDELFIVNPEDSGDPELRKDIEPAIDQDLAAGFDNAAEVFEAEPDTRSDFEKSLEEVDPESRPYLKALYTLMGSSFENLKSLGSSEPPGIKAIQVWNPRDREYLAKAFSITHPNSERAMTALLNQGWRFDQAIESGGNFMAIFWRPKSEEFKVPYTPGQPPESQNPKVPEPPDLKMPEA